MKPETVKRQCLSCHWCLQLMLFPFLDNHALCSPPPARRDRSQYARFHAKWAATIHPSQAPRQLNIVWWHLIFSA
jgi:hypothetical protein